MLSNHPVSSPFSPPAFSLPQHQGLSQWVSASHRVVKVLSFSISPSTEYSGLISFRTDWFVLLAVQVTLKSLLQHQFKSINSLALSLLYDPVLTSVHNFDQMDLCWQSDIPAFESRFVIAFLLRSKHLLISWLQSPSTGILKPRKIKSVTVSTFPPSIYLPWSDGTRCHDLSFLNIEL